MSQTLFSVLMSPNSSPILILEPVSREYLARVSVKSSPTR